MENTLAPAPDSQPATLAVPLASEEFLIPAAGTALLVNGSLLTLREDGYALLAEALKGSISLPFELAGQLLYLPGPTPPSPPHTVGRSWTELGLPLPRLFELGLRGTIGDGFHDPIMQNLLNTYHSFALSIPPEDAFRAAQSIHQIELLPMGIGPLQCECVYRYHVKGFPVQVTHTPAE